MKKTAAFLIFASVLLQGCGWDSKTRLVPTYEREVIALSGTYDVGEDSVSFSPFSNEGLQTVIIETGSGSRYTNRVAYDLVQVKGAIEEGVDRREFTYLAERRQIPQEEPKLTYELITVRKVHGENDVFTGDYEFKQYSLKCASIWRGLPISDQARLPK